MIVGKQQRWYKTRKLQNHWSNLALNIPSSLGKRVAPEANVARQKATSEAKRSLEKDMIIAKELDVLTSSHSRENIQWTELWYITDFDTDMGIICSRKLYWELESCVKGRKLYGNKERERLALSEKWQKPSQLSMVHAFFLYLFYKVNLSSNN